MATCLLDLYPEVEESLTETMDKYLSGAEEYKEFPIGACLMVAGLLMILIVDQAVMSYKESHGGIPNAPAPHNVTNNGPSLPLQELAKSSGLQMLESAHVNESAPDIIASENGMTDENSGTDFDAKKDMPSSRRVSVIDHHMPLLDDKVSPFRSLLMLAALSLHSVFEGLSVGLQDTTQGVLNIFAAVVLHKCIIAFSIGLNLVQSKLSFWAVIRSNAVFCLSTPIGIAIGILVIKFADESAAAIAGGVLQGLACGTFLYVTFFEVLPHEFNKSGDRVVKSFFVVLGFMVVNGVVLLEITMESKNDSPVHAAPSIQLNSTNGTFLTRS